MAEAAAAVRRGGGGFALLMVDLDRFRSINDTLGHDTGDRVLLDVAQRIQGCLRQDDTLARLGADQFALLLDQADAAAAEATARRVLHVVAQPFSNDGAPFTLTCSIGVALAPAHGSTWTNWRAMPTPRCAPSRPPAAPTSACTRRAPRSTAASTCGWTTPCARRW